ncbi:MAG: hypothetical protein D8H96_19735 [Lautropia sp.]|nr:MAG: hypothetical protein D8H96_19735 [Lautropia sp.]
MCDGLRTPCPSRWAAGARARWPRRRRARSRRPSSRCQPCRDPEQPAWCPALPNQHCRAPAIRRAHRPRPAPRHRAGFRPCWCRTTTAGCRRRSAHRSDRAPDCGPSPRPRS